MCLTHWWRLMSYHVIRIFPITPWSFAVYTHYTWLKKKKIGSAQWAAALAVLQARVELGIYLPCCDFVKRQLYHNKLVWHNTNDFVWTDQYKQNFFIMSSFFKFEFWCLEICNKTISWMSDPSLSIYKLVQLDYFCSREKGCLHDLRYHPLSRITLSQSLF